jgi:hypothetical protein
MVDGAVAVEILDDVVDAQEAAAHGGRAHHSPVLNDV